MYQIWIVMGSILFRHFRESMRIRDCILEIATGSIFASMIQIYSPGHKIIEVCSILEKYWFTSSKAVFDI